MPPKKYPRVILAVQGAIHDAIQDHLTGLADRHLAGAPDCGCVLHSLRVDSALWTIARNKNHFSYVLARVRLSNGDAWEHRWKVPYEGPIGRGGTLKSHPARYVHLDTYRRIAYALGARAGSGRSEGGIRSSRSRSRPEIGRAFSRSGRKPS